MDIEGWRLAVVDKAVALRTGGAPLVVGINSFRFYGTNAHLVLSEYRPATAVTAAAVADDTGED